MRQILLNDFSGGVNRLRTKGGASEKYLYTLKNAYVTHENTVQSRPGSYTTYKIPAGTIGLTAFQNKLHVFAGSIIVMTDARFVCNVIKHPVSTTATLVAIHKAVPFTGNLYVVAEFNDGSIYHFYLRSPATWVASTDYMQNDLVIPSTPNGYAYRARRLGSAYPTWAAGAARAVSNIIEPTVYNGFYFTVTAVFGTNPTSGQIEPTWNASAGATTIESSDGQQQPTPPGTGTPIVIPQQPGIGPGSGGYVGNPAPTPAPDPVIRPGILEP